MPDDCNAQSANMAHDEQDIDDVGGALDESTPQDNPPPMHYGPRTVPTTRATPTRSAEAQAHGRGTGTPAPVPAYLRGLIDAGAFDQAELELVPHRRATVRFSADNGREVACPLAHLAPDCIATMRRKAGPGHVAGAIAWRDDRGDEHVANFALFVAPDATETQAAPAISPEVAELRRAIERLEQRQDKPTQIDLMGRELLLDLLEKARKPQDPMAQLSQVIGEARKLLGFGAKLRTELAPLMETVQEAAEGKPGRFEAVLDELASPENIQAAFDWARGKLSGEKIVDTTADVGEAEAE